MLCIPSVCYLASGEPGQSWRRRLSIPLRVYLCDGLRRPTRKTCLISQLSMRCVAVSGRAPPSRSSRATLEHDLLRQERHCWAARRAKLGLATGEREVTISGLRMARVDAPLLEPGRLEAV